MKQILRQYMQDSATQNLLGDQVLYPYTAPHTSGWHISIHVSKSDHTAHFSCLCAPVFQCDSHHCQLLFPKNSFPPPIYYIFIPVNCDRMGACRDVINLRTPITNPSDTVTCAASARSSRFRQVTVRELATPAHELGSRFSNRYFPRSNRTRDPKM